MPVLLALLPIVLIFVLLVVRRTPADIAGLAGWLLAVAVAWLYFRTPLAIALQSSLAGVVGSFPITLMVMTSILQVTVMLETGAIRRVVALIKSVAPHDQVVQIMIVNIGFGTLLAAMGATPVSILPPIMLAMGYSSFTAIAIPALGYDALCTYALLGIPIVVFSNFVGLPVAQVGGIFARFMPVISTCIGLGMLWIVGGWKLVVRGLVPTLIAGLTAGFIAIGMNAIGMVTLTGVAAGLGVVAAMLAYLRVTGRPLVDRCVLDAADIQAERQMSLWTAISPWIILTFFAVLVNVPFLPFLDLTFNRLAMPVELIPGAPEKVRLLWQAYFWILVSTLLALPFLKPTRAQLQTIPAQVAETRPAPDAGLRRFLCDCLPHQPFRQGVGLEARRSGQQYGLRDRERLLDRLRHPLPAGGPLPGALRRFYQRVGSLGNRHADLPAPLDRGEDRRRGDPDRGRQRDRRRAGQRHLAGQAPECRGEHRPDRRRSPGAAHHVCRFAGDHRRVRGPDHVLGVAGSLCGSDRFL